MVRTVYSGSRARNCWASSIHGAHDGRLCLASRQHQLRRRNALARIAEPRSCQLPTITLTVPSVLPQTRAHGARVRTIRQMEKRSEENNESEAVFDEKEVLWFISLMYDFYWEEWGDDENL